MMSVVISIRPLVRLSRCNSAQQSRNLHLGSASAAFWKREKKAPEEEFDLGSVLEGSAAVPEALEDVHVAKVRSRMSDYHRCLALGLNPAEEGVTMPKSIDPRRARRRLFGEYGLASGVKPGEVYKSRDIMRRWRHLEELGYPETVRESMDRIKAEGLAQRKRLEANEAEVDRKLTKAMTIRQEMEAKILRKEAEIKAQQEKRERMIEEIREHFGYRVDPKTEKFQEMLAQKEAEEKKVEKERRKKEKQAKQLAKLLAQSQGLAGMKRGGTETDESLEKEAKAIS